MCFNIPLTNELRIDMARFDIPVSGWTCLRTETELAKTYQEYRAISR